MRGYITIPDSILCNSCKYCGARPVIAMAEIGEYVVKCPNNSAHYKTQQGLIDIDDWNRHNPASAKKSVSPVSRRVSDSFFQLNGAIVTLATAE